MSITFFIKKNRKWLNMCTVQMWPNWNFEMSLTLKCQSYSWGFFFFFFFFFIFQNLLLEQVFYPLQLLVLKFHPSSTLKWDSSLSDVCGSNFCSANALKICCELACGMEHRVKPSWKMWALCEVKAPVTVPTKRPEKDLNVSERRRRLCPLVWLHS